MRIGLKKITNMCFLELNETLSKAVNSCKNTIVIGDLNIDVNDPDKKRNDYLSEFVDTFSISISYIEKHVIKMYPVQQLT